MTSSIEVIDNTVPSDPVCCGHSPPHPIFCEQFPPHLDWASEFGTTGLALGLFASFSLACLLWSQVFLLEFFLNID
jgi:hypothetical protein